MTGSALDLSLHRRKRSLARDKVSPDIRGAKAGKLPRFVAPELATLVDSVPGGEEWAHEIKLDGYRILCRVDNGRAVLLTRRAQDWTERFPPIAVAARALPVRQAFLDGELVALDRDGKSSFQQLQNWLKSGEPSAVVYYAFDLLHLDGRDLTGAGLEERKQLLAALLKIPAAGGASGVIRYSPHWIGGGERLYRECCRRGLEGIISKRRNQPYRSDRGRDWVKIKCVQRQEFVIGGFTDPAGGRVALGALLLGFYESNGRLRYAGRVGTGFNQSSLRDLRARLDELRRDAPAFANPPKGHEAAGVHWVEPKLVAEVSFSEWTQDNFLRHPSFQGLREDKPAAAVSRETAKPPPRSNMGDGGDNLEIAGVALTHPDRILYPEQRITKRDLALYYEKIAAAILPHLERRPLTLVRCPEGRHKQCFFQRHLNDPLPGAGRAGSARRKPSRESWVSVDSLRGLMGLVQMGVLEIHTWGSRVDRIDKPDRLIFDLDPDASIPWRRLVGAALDLRDRLAVLGLAAFVKTTGGKGLHVVVPIVPKENWEFVKGFSKSVAEQMTRDHPDLYTATMSKRKRKGKIFIDYLRNARTATAVSAYSTRALPGAPVSTPLAWEELSRDVRSEFTVKNVPARLARSGKDPWEGYEGARAALPKFAAR